MKKSLFELVDFLLFSNIFIATCAIAQGLLTYKFISVSPSMPVLAILFVSTICIYNFSLLQSRPKHPEKSPFIRVRWIFAHYKLILITSLLAAVSLVPLFFLLSLNAQILLSILGIISLAYNMPLFSAGGRKFGLRNIPGIKLFMIAFVWSASCVALPIIEAESLNQTSISVTDTFILFVKRFLFVAAITIPFDIRDLFQDREANLKTIPVILGEKKAYIFCIGMLIAYLLLLVLYQHNRASNYFLPLLLTIMASGWLIFKAGFKKNEYYYFLLLDGMLILQYLAIFLFEKIKLF
jgi:4-hydroxybenzoate polyprenyltransferase